MAFRSTCVRLYRDPEEATNKLRPRSFHQTSRGSCLHHQYPTHCNGSANTPHLRVFCLQSIRFPGQFGELSLKMGSLIEYKGCTLGISTYKRMEQIQFPKIAVDFLANHSKDGHHDHCQIHPRCISFGWGTQDPKPAKKLSSIQKAESAWTLMTGPSAVQWNNTTPEPY